MFKKELFGNLLNSFSYISKNVNESSISDLSKFELIMEGDMSYYDIDKTNLDFDHMHSEEQALVFGKIKDNLTDSAGNKSLELNLEAAAKWPPTYAETSKSGKGIHLHYTYIGKVEELSSFYAEGIEIKTLLGNGALRRKLSKCNSVNVTPLDGGLPKKEKPLITTKSIQSEKGLRELIERNLRKEIHPGTKPSVDFIHKVLGEAYDSGMAYDVMDMRPNILTFALRSTNQADKCMRLVQEMQFTGKSEMPVEKNHDGPLVFFDVEVYPNLFVVCWKVHGSGDVHKMVNPTSTDIEPLLNMKLVGFNNRRYDNHILYARYLGFSNEELYGVSQKIINNNHNAYFGEAYNISFTDIYDFSSKKQGLKKFEIELGILHMELDIPWDEPVPEELWDKVVDYCVNDVNATEAVFENRAQDFVARQILCELSGLTENHTTQMHTAKIIFGNDRDANQRFVYTHLNKEFPGYVYDGVTDAETGKTTWCSMYKGEEVGEGGYVYAEPGIYEDVAVLDVASMHPTSIKELNAFGPYTPRFVELLDARLAIKHQNYEKAAELLDGKLAKFLTTNEQDAQALSYALKIVINIVYGLTSAKFENPFRDNRNKDNIVAKRGALFMIDLKHHMQDLGFQVIHIKTDSIKIPGVSEHPEIIDIVTEFGKKYGYDFEHEVTYDKFCLVNNAVYVAKDGDEWSAVGAEFQHPYIFKTLFSRDMPEFNDYCETKNVVQGVMYLDFAGTGEIENMVHVGRTGSFVPVVYGGDLWRIKEGNKYAVTGTKGYKWITRDVAIERDKNAELLINMTYFNDMVAKARATIEKFGSFDELVN